MCDCVSACLRVIKRRQGIPHAHTHTRGQNIHRARKRCAANDGLDIRPNHPKVINTLLFFFWLCVSGCVRLFGRWCRVCVHRCSSCFLRVTFVQFWRPKNNQENVTLRVVLSSEWSFMLPLLLACTLRWETEYKINRNYFAH